MRRLPGTRSELMTGALGVLGAIATTAIGACSPGPAPPEDSGVVAPWVAPGVAPDYTFRWPATATAIMSVRADTGLGPNVSQATIDLGAPGADGNRPFTCSELEAVGGHAAIGVALGISLALPKGEVPITPTGALGPDAKAPIWLTWVYTWRLFATIAVGSEQDVAGETVGLPKGLDFKRTNDGPSRWPGAVHLTLTVEMSTPEARAYIKAKAAGAAFGISGEQLETRIEADIDPRTLQPLKVKSTSRYAERELPLVVSYEFDWSPSNVLAALASARIPNEDSR